MDDSGYICLENIIKDYMTDEKHEIYFVHLKNEGIRLGDGQFGVVELGILSRPNADVRVAIKKPKKEDDELQKNMLKEEMKIMAQLQEGLPHENILKMIGCITSSEHFCLLTEYCELGSLSIFLREKIDSNKFEDEIVFEEHDSILQSIKQTYRAQQDPRWAEGFENRRKNGQITTSDLLSFALQIARAMQFLTEKNVLHRDVALRNIFIKPDFTLKVADFGLSRKLREDTGYYLMARNRTALPILYAAPESLIHHRFTSHSECWSFGVVIWELFTFAKKIPYYSELNLNDSSVISEFFLCSLMDYLRGGRRLTLPNTVPPRVKRLVNKLWNEKPMERPSFMDCEELLREQLLLSCPKIQTSLINPLDHHRSTPVSPQPSAEKAKQNIQEADKCYSKVAEQGYARTQYNRGISYEKEQGMDQSHEKADKRCTKAAEQGDAKVQYHRGVSYEKGQGVDQSFEEAVRWYTIAAEQGDADAQYHLGICYEKGQGVDQSFEEAVKWYTYAAEQGHVQAQFNLALKYIKGQGVAQSQEEAAKWYQRWARGGGNPS